MYFQGGMLIPVVWVAVPPFNLCLLFLGACSLTGWPAQNGGSTVALGSSYGEQSAVMWGLEPEGLLISSKKIAKTEVKALM